MEDRVAKRIGGLLVGGGLFWVVVALLDKQWGVFGLILASPFILFLVVSGTYVYLRADQRERKAMPFEEQPTCLSRSGRMVGGLAVGVGMLLKIISAFALPGGGQLLGWVGLALVAGGTGIFLWARHPASTA